MNILECEFEQALTNREAARILEKYDPEAGRENWPVPLGWIVFTGLLLFSLFHLYT